MNNIFSSILSRVLALLAEFEEYSLFHILREHNSCVDRLAKVGTNLDEGETLVNEVKGRLPIP
jgi:hypothetical protein